MHVQKIEVEGFQNGTLSGNIALISGDQRINVPLTLTADGKPDTLPQRIVAEAIRLTRRMPEFRSGHGTLSFADNLITRTA